jgi:hypothetical protein
MTTEHTDESISIAEQNQILFSTIGLPLARMVHSGEIDPETVSRDELATKLKALGNTLEDAFEVHITHIEAEMPLVAHCISQEQPRSGVVLLFTLIETEVNSLLRILMSIRGFPTSAITDALKGTSFNTKLDVLLPLLEVEVPAHFRNAALQCKSIRNLIVHNKAAPALMSDIANKPGDGELENERSLRFFSENPIDRLRADLEGFFEAGLHEDTAMQWSYHLFDKYFKGLEDASEA